MEHHEILKKYWGFDSFRPLQEEIIQSVLQEQDTLALMPTGGGKSLCFQVPGIAKPGVCLVVSPLIALMIDQVQHLKKMGIQAVALHSGMSYSEIDQTLDRCIYGEIKFLYISPERIQSDLFAHRSEKMDLNLIAIDEAHCISQWGYDFRPAYLQISSLRETHPKVPILALTATATPAVVSDIQDKLGFDKENVFRKSFVRENLSYNVLHEENKRNRLLSICEKVGGCGVVYVNSRRKTADISTFLQRHGILATSYHAGLAGPLRAKRQDDWMNNRAQVIVATNAFGMGIDKPDVRFVVHLDLPQNIESYFQEAGRAGRDGKKAWAILLKEPNDILSLKARIQQNFPEPKTIKLAYRALLNHLQIAAGSGQNSSFPIDISTISKSFNIGILDLYNSFKLLENEGYLTFNEGFYNPSRVKMTVSPEVIYDYEVRHPKLAALIQLLLRSYSGMFDDAVKIDETTIARRLNINQKDVVSQLNSLNNKQIIDYTPATDSAMVTLTLPAQYDRSLTLSQDVYHNRKKLALDKMNAMIDYLGDGVCRQRRLVRYFGEKHATDCGHCDICRQKKNKTPPPRDIEVVIVSTLRKKSLRPDEVTRELKQYTQDDVIKNIARLVDESILIYKPNKTLAVKESKAQMIPKFAPKDRSRGQKP